MTRRGTAVAHAGQAALRAHREAARGVRRLVAEVYGATPADALILAPGSTVALRLLFQPLHVRRVLLSDAEYFGPAAFPAAAVSAVPVEQLATAAVRLRPDAVVLSVVSWHGERLPLERVFASIRDALGAEAPLLVADFAHAGAAGFPRIAATGADVVIGDAGKWVTPADWPDRVAFLWLRTAALRRVAQRAFAPLYLGTSRPAGALEGRWVDPDAAARIAEWARGQRGVRSALLARHAADLALAARLAARCGLPAPATPLVCVPAGSAARRIPRWARERGLTWRMPDGSTRVTCRADAREPIADSQ